MQLIQRKENLADENLSPRIYAALVDSLFQNPIPMLVGAACTAIAAVLTAVKTGDFYVWPCALMIVLSGVLRAYDMQSYKKTSRKLTLDEAAWWESRYRNGAILYAGILGLWCWIVLVGSDDAVAHMLCITVTTGYIAAAGAEASR